MTPATAGAEDVRDPSPITVSNSVIARSVRPGERLQLEVVVKNQTTRPFSFTAVPGDVARRRAGSASVEATEPGSTKRTAGRWIQPVPSAWRLEARTQRELRLDVVVPADAGPGGRYAVVTVQAAPIGGSGAVRVLSEIPVVVLLTVSGTYERRVDVDVRDVAAVDWTGGRRTWRVTLHNDGDVHENLSGALLVDPVIGADRRLRLPAGVLLPDERRSYRVPVDLRTAPDLVRVRARVERDDAPPARSARTRSLVLPWWLLAVLAVVVGAGVWRRRHRDRQGHGHSCR